MSNPQDDNQDSKPNFFDGLEDLPQTPKQEEPKGDQSSAEVNFEDFLKPLESAPVAEEPEISFETLFARPPELSKDDEAFVSAESEPSLSEVLETVEPDLSTSETIEADSFKAAPITNQDTAANDLPWQTQANPFAEQDYGRAEDIEEPAPELQVPQGVYKAYADYDYSDDSLAQEVEAEQADK